jgi:hypothetical protein
MQATVPLMVSNASVPRSAPRLTISGNHIEDIMADIPSLLERFGRVDAFEYHHYTYPAHAASIRGLTAVVGLFVTPSDPTASAAGSIDVDSATNDTAAVDLLVQSQSTREILLAASCGSDIQLCAPISSFDDEYLARSRAPEYPESLADPRSRHEDIITASITTTVSNVSELISSPTPSDVAGVRPGAPIQRHDTLMMEDFDGGPVESKPN